ncbi:PR-1-like protein [Mycena venus]|uniref:PR-1-like protein n=1 Tax=Mycena venus TaxID=2733690 RepID=A0A8H6Z375_9AGAR|nr:PR-1-like protein [Mycena venus]
MKQYPQLILGLLCLVINAVAPFSADPRQVVVVTVETTTTTWTTTTLQVTALSPASSTTLAGSSPLVSETSSGNGDFEGTFLDLHNNERAEHGASNLTWSNTLAMIAQSWANNCTDTHSGGKFRLEGLPLGENIAAGTENYSIPDVMNDFIDGPSEKFNYNPLAPADSHWTQIVWKATSELGCGVATCLLFEPPFDGQEALFYVCEYFPPGNIEGKFDANVQP